MPVLRGRKKGKPVPKDVESEQEEDEEYIPGKDVKCKKKVRRSAPKKVVCKKKVGKSVTVKLECKQEDGESVPVKVECKQEEGGFVPVKVECKLEEGGSVPVKVECKKKVGKSVRIKLECKQESEEGSMRAKAATAPPGEVKVKRKCGRPRNPIPRHKRVSHIMAEHRRREKISDNLQTLRTMIPNFTSTGRDSKADILQQASSRSQVLEKENAARQTLLAELRAEKEALDADVKRFQKNLPEAQFFEEQPITSEQRLLNYIAAKTKEDVKNFVTGFILKPLHEVFEASTDVSSKEAFVHSTLNWAAHNLTQQSLRPVVTGAICKFSRDTSFIASPELLQTEALEMCRRDCDRHAAAPADTTPASTAATAATATSASGADIKPDPPVKSESSSAKTPRQGKGKGTAAGRKRGAVRPSAMDVSEQPASSKPTPAKSKRAKKSTVKTETPQSCSFSSSSSSSSSSSGTSSSSSSSTPSTSPSWGQQTPQSAIPTLVLVKNEVDWTMAESVVADAAAAPVSMTTKAFADSLLWSDREDLVASLANLSSNISSLGSLPDLHWGRDGLDSPGGSLDSALDMSPFGSSSGGGFEPSSVLSDPAGYEGYDSSSADQGYSTPPFNTNLGSPVDSIFQNFPECFAASSSPSSSGNVLEGSGPLGDLESAGGLGHLGASPFRDLDVAGPLSDLECAGPLGDLESFPCLDVPRNDFPQPFAVSLAGSFTDTLFADTPQSIQAGTHQLLSLQNRNPNRHDDNNNHFPNSRVSSDFNQLYNMSFPSSSAANPFFPADLSLDTLDETVCPSLLSSASEFPDFGFLEYEQFSLTTTLAETS